MGFAEEHNREAGPPSEPVRHLQPAQHPEQLSPANQGGSGAGSDGVSAILDALRASADQELTIADRVSGKARQAFALGAGVFVVAQTVAFGSFDAKHLTLGEQKSIIIACIVAVVVLGIAGIAAIRADSLVTSRDLPLDALEADLNAAFEGDPEAIGRLGGYYLGVVRSRRTANDRRRYWYKVARAAVVLSLVVTGGELILALLERA